MEVRDLSPNGHSAREIVATYDYLDEGGKLLYQVVRFEPKTFRQRKPDGNGGWIWNLNGVRRVPYRLPELQTAEQVFIVEGEKDVESLRSLGLVATTNPGGAGKWHEEYGEALRGKHVVIIADNDKPGQEHAAQVATALHLVAASVKVIEKLPMPDGQSVKDVTEWVTHGFDARLLYALAEDTPSWSPDAEKAADDWKILFHAPGDFLTVSPLSFSIEGFLQNDGATMLGGLSGHGKTFMMLSVVKALLAGPGTKLWDLFPVLEKAERILYLIPECALAPFTHRLKLMGLLDYTQNGKLLVRTLNLGTAPKLSDKRLLKAAQGAHVFLDTALRFSEGDENTATDISKGLASELFALTAAGARATVGAHHSPKSFARETVMTLENVLRGSGDLGAMLSTCWGVKQVDEAQNILHIQNCKPRDFQPCNPFQIIGRPHIDQQGDFQLLKAPGECGSLSDEQPELNRGGGAPEAKRSAKAANLALLRGYLAANADLTTPELREMFANDDVKLPDSTIRSYKHDLKKGHK
jgi:5S rRNA maturation endonuclease (ribonuclease M5)